MTDFSEFRNKLTTFKSVYEREKQRLAQAEVARDNLQKQFDLSEADIKSYSEVLDGFKQIISVFNETSMEEITESLNLGLQKAFPENKYELKLNVYKHGPTDMMETLVRERPGASFKPLAKQGKGFGSIVSILENLFLAVRANGLRFFWFDELIAGVDVDRVPIVIDMLKAFAQRHDLTILITEHGIFKHTAEDDLSIFTFKNVNNAQVITFTE